MDLCVFSVFCMLCFVSVCLYVPCGHLLGKGCPLGSCLWCLTVSLSLCHWYPGSGVVLDCIDSWSLHPYLLTETLSYSQYFNPLYSDGFSYSYWYNMGLAVRKPIFGGLRTTKEQTSLCIRAVWSAPLLFAYCKVSYPGLIQAKFQFSS